MIFEVVNSEDIMTSIENQESEVRQRKVAEPKAESEQDTENKNANLSQPETESDQVRR